MEEGCSVQIAAFEQSAKHDLAETAPSLCFNREAAMGSNAVREECCKKCCAEPNGLRQVDEMGKWPIVGLHARGSAVKAGGRFSGER